MIMSVDKALDYLEKHRPGFLDETMDLIRIRSISTDPDYRESVIQAAEFLREKLNEIGFEDSRLLETGGSPVVFAQ